MKDKIMLDQPVRTAWFNHNEYEIHAIAEICHSMNRALCTAFGDHSQPAWQDAEDWQRQSAINGVKFHLIELEEGRDLQPGLSHQNWMDEKLSDGWTYGAKKDPEQKTHPCLLPFDELPQEQQAKDFLFIESIRSYAL